MIKVEPKITSSGLHRRQALYFPIECRGILVDIAILAEASDFVNKEIETHLAIANKQWDIRLYVGQENSVFEKAKAAVAAGKISKEQAQFAVALQKNNEFNIRSPEKLLAFLKDKGYKVPKITSKDENGEWSSDESTSELALRQLIRENQFNYPDGDAALISLLSVRELLTLKSRYLNARLFPKPEGMVFLSSYNAGSGTLTGRRNSKKHIYGYGGNAQNFPKHSKTAELFRKGLICRPGTIFLSVDQMSAEDWPVSALAGNQSALTDLATGADRHSRLASFIFNIPFDSRTPKEWKDSIERYLGKKTRHANNYDMKPPRFHDEMMKEGRYFDLKACEDLLARTNTADPNIKGVFHKYIQNEINNKRTLVTPYGRERVFLGFRPNTKNGNLMNEAYAWIPQSVVGDNTGFAVEMLQLNPEPDINIVQEGHDSIVQEVTFNGSSVDMIDVGLARSVEAFDREIQFYNGIKINIPIEAELSYNFAKSVKIKTFDRKGICDALQELGPRP